MKLPSALVLLVASTRLLGCSSEASGTEVSGSVQLVRESGGDSGETGFAFPNHTPLDADPFHGSCSIDDTADGKRVSIWIERASPDAFGLTSLALDVPLETPVAPGSATVSAVAGGTTFEDADGSCEIVWSQLHEPIGRIDLQIECGALAGGPAAQTVSLSADLLFTFCD